MKHLLSLLLCMALCLSGLHAQTPNILWQNCNGGNNEDYAMHVSPMNGGNFIVTGYTKSNNGSIVFHGGYDVWVAEYNSTGSKLWEKSYGGSGYDYGRCVLPTPADGGFMVLCDTRSSDGDVTGLHGTNNNADIWLLKIDDTGKKMWQKCYGGSDWEEGRSMVRSIDNGFVITGYTSSLDGNVSGLHSTIGGSHTDAWVLKVNDTGKIQWQKCLGGTLTDEGSSIINTRDSGFLMAGNTSSNDGNVSGLHSADTMDAWLVKLDSVGNVQWQKCYGGTKSEAANCIVSATTALSAGADNGYIFVGATNSNDGDVSGLKGPVGGFFTLNADVWVVKINSAGTVEWQTCLGGGNWDVGKSITTPLPGGAYILTGITQSSNGDVTGFHGQADMWVVKLDSAGAMLWQRPIGGTNAEAGNCVIRNGNNVVLAGSTNSGDGDVGSAFPPNVYPDGWLLELTGLTSVDPPICIGNDIKIYPNPTNGTLQIKGIGAGNVSILTCLGQLVKTANVTDNVSLKELPAGTYMICVYDDNRTLLHYEQVVKY